MLQTPDERIRLIRFTRQSLDDARLKSIPIVAGVGGLSTRETVRLAHEASEAGASVTPEHRDTPACHLHIDSDAGMVILPAYYAASLAADEDQIVQYFVDICEASPVCERSPID